MVILGFMFQLKLLPILPNGGFWKKILILDLRCKDILFVVYVSHVPFSPGKRNLEIITVQKNKLLLILFFF